MGTSCCTGKPREEHLYFKDEKDKDKEYDKSRSKNIKSPSREEWTPSINIGIFGDSQNDTPLLNTRAMKSSRKQNNHALLDYEQLGLDYINKETRSECGFSQILDKCEKSQKAEDSDNQEDEEKDDVYYLPDEFVMDADEMDSGDPDLLRFQSIDFQDLKRKRSKSLKNLSTTEIPLNKNMSKRSKMYAKAFNEVQAQCQQETKNRVTLDDGDQIKEENDNSEESKENFIQDGEQANIVSSANVYSPEEKDFQPVKEGIEKHEIRDALSEGVGQYMSTEIEPNLDSYNLLDQGFGQIGQNPNQRIKESLSQRPISDSDSFTISNDATNGIPMKKAPSKIKKTMGLLGVSYIKADKIQQFRNSSSKKPLKRKLSSTSKPHPIQIPPKSSKIPSQSLASPKKKDFSGLLLKKINREQRIKPLRKTLN
ncbi:unnamed protein product [Moneuplotes crassus]|uniref:Uncharacterized protein n=1 Tax=Euplotes crassus TaxID=5936 RepID=A0AAD1Y771_EUPCR|nr:unnamed protein product [Moneuplotes crassus]